MPTPGGRPLYASGESEIDLDWHELRLLGAPAPIGGRAFDILALLVRSAGLLVSKDEVMERVWPDVIVNENTLQVHISAVWKALGAQRTMLKTWISRLLMPQSKRVFRRSLRQASA